MISISNFTDNSVFALNESFNASIFLTTKSCFSLIGSKGQGAAWLEQTVIPDYGGMLLWILPPGGFSGHGHAAGRRSFFDTGTALTEQALP